MTNTYKWSGKLNASNQVKPECLNVHIGFCGDGILDNGSSSASTNINAPLAG